MSQSLQVLLYTQSVVLLPINLVKRPGIFKARLKHLIHDLACMHLVPHTWSRHHAQRRPSPHTMLQLLRHAPLILREKLPGKPTLAAQRTRPDLQTRLMSQVIVLDFKLEMVPRVNHFMRHSIFLMPSIPELIRTQQYPMIQAKPPALLIRAHPTQYVLGIQVSTEFGDFVFEEGYDGRVLQEVVAIGFAARAD